jgi:pimeloyl-ACP methyl ester carboxylesterase
VRSPARDLTTPLFPYEPRFVRVRVAGSEHDMAYVEHGTGEPVLLLHGNPTWSFLYRDVIPALGPGVRAIAPDFLGFGRSDKLERAEDYTLANHLAALSQLVDALGLEKVTLVVHDWAGPIGLAWAVDNPARVRRLVIMNTWAFAPRTHNKVPQPLKTFRRRGLGELLVLGLDVFVRLALPFGVYHRKERMTKEVMRAYRAPFPDWRSRWPVLAFPRHIPLAETDAAFERMKKTDDGLRSLEQPALLVWGARDTVFPPRVMAKFKERLGGLEGEVVFDDAAHFLQEDRPRDIGEAIARFVRES